MARIFLTHKVKDYDEWKEGYDADGERRQAAGLIEGGHFHSSDDRNSFLIVWDTEIGIDETTAIWVEGTRAEVMGMNVVSFYESDNAKDSGEVTLNKTVLPGGTIFDFETRKELTGPPPLPDRKPVRRRR